MKMPADLNDFHATFVPKSTQRKYVIAILNGNPLLAVTPGKAPQLVMSLDQTETLKFYCDQRLCMGQWQDHDCEVWNLIPEAAAVEGFIEVELRSFLAQSIEPEFSLASRASQLLDWRAKNKFCGQCGSVNQVSSEEHTLLCAACNLHHYPKISPCIIVAVTYGDKLLMARHPSWPENRYSTLAGFVEAGESAEQAVHREIFEEVGVEIDNLRYIGSQAWPYPGQLMLGYIADAISDEIVVDDQEIAEALWFDYDNLPSVIAPPTIMAGKLIQQVVMEARAKYGKKPTV